MIIIILNVSNPSMPYWVFDWNLLIPVLTESKVLPLLPGAVARDMMKHKLNDPGENLMHTERFTKM